MTFREHLNFAGKHAELSPSNYHWLNYDDEKLITVHNNKLAAEKGTELHGIAEQLIRNRINLPKNKRTLNMYVNDAIGFLMTPEQPLVYSDKCFGTADAISFRKNFLRIHDLKTGETPANVLQLEIYAALFCLEYGIEPSTIEMECRIYQSNDIVTHQPLTDAIEDHMEKIKHFDKILRELDEEYTKSEV